MSDDDLIALGFARTDIGALIAPPVVRKVAVKIVQGVKL